MKPIYLRLIADFLDEYADRVGTDGCNDWDWPADWTKDDRRAFIAEAIAYNENRPVSSVTSQQVDEQGDHMPNFWAAGTLAALVKASAK